MYIFVFNHNLGNITVKKNGYYHYMIWKCTSKKVVAVCVYIKIFLDECQQMIRIRPLLIWKAKFLFKNGLPINKPAHIKERLFLSTSCTHYFES